jgi:hypothetical protein
MNRRGFLGAILAAGVAPAFVGSRVLMPVRRLVAPGSLTTWTGAGPLYFDRYELDHALDALIYRINPEPTPLLAKVSRFARLGNGKGMPILDPAQVYESIWPPTLDT